MNTSKLSFSQITKIAGIGYLIIFISGIYANFFVLENLIVQNNSSATVSNILGNEFLFRIEVVTFLIMVIFDVVLTWALYIIFEPIDRNLSLLSALLRLVNCSIFGIALFHLLNVLQMLSGADYLQAIGTSQLEANVMLSLQSFSDTWLIGLVFFGIHLLFLGQLIIKSGFVPKFIGVLLIIASLGYMTDSFANFLLSNYSEYKEIFQLIVIIPGIIGEFSFTVWLLKKHDSPGTINRNTVTAV